MNERSLVFPATEFHDRIARLQGWMSRDGLDALLLTTPADIFYVTGFLTRFWESPARPWFVVLPSAGDPVAVIPEIGADLMGRTWIGDIRTWNAPFPEDDGVSLLASTLAEVSPNTGRIGLPMGLETHVRMPLADLRRIERAISPRVFVDGTLAVQRAREIKSPAEIGKIRTTCAIATRAFARVPAFARPGCGLDAIFRAFQIALLEEGVDWVGYLAGGAGQEGYRDVISPAGPHPIAPGDVLMLDTGAVREGYFCDFDRNFAVGRPSDATRRIYDALWQATETALENLRPGMPAHEGYRILSDSIRRHGAEPAGGRLGHGLGIALTEWPSFTPHDATPLQEGMVLTLEPAAEVAPGRVLVHEENVVLRAQGCELLSARAPLEMQRIDA